MRGVKVLRHAAARCRHAFSMLTPMFRQRRRCRRRHAASAMFSSAAAILRCCCCHISVALLATLFTLIPRR